MSEEELKVYTFDEVAEHNQAEDLWIVYNGKVYDVTQYVDEHPGGQEVVVDCAGADATEAFDDIGHSDDAHDILKDLLIGKVEGGVVGKTQQKNDSTSEGGISTPLVAVIVLLLAAGAYYYLQNN